MRTVHQMDAIKWLKSQNNNTLSHIICSIPDASELQMSQHKYPAYFGDTVELLCKKLSAKGYLILVQTDRKSNGQVFSKATLATQRAGKAGCNLMWHKIALLAQVGKIHNMGFTTGYTHVLCYSRSNKPGAASADVIPSSLRTWKNGMPLAAAKVAVDFVKQQQKVMAGAIYAPFCGKGTILALADKANLQSVGIEIDKARCTDARYYVL